MGSCVICLGDALPCLYVDSYEWRKRNIRRIIEKHLWWWHFKEPSSKKNSYICVRCWKMLSAFHTFYLEVEKSHQQFDETKWSFVKGSIEDDSCELIKNMNVKSEPPDFNETEEDIICTANDSETTELLPCSETDNEASNCTFDDADTSESKVYIPKSDEHLAQGSYHLSCDLCNVALNNFTDLKYHYRLSHDVAGYAVCCNKKFYNRGQFTDHLRVHENPDYFKCPLCTRVLSNRSSYENHIERHNKPKKKLYIKCAYCWKSFSKKSNHERHLLSYCRGRKRKSKSNNIYRNNKNFISNKIENVDRKPNDTFIDKKSDYDDIDEVSANNEPFSNISLNYFMDSKNTETMENHPVVKSERDSGFKNDEQILSQNYADSHHTNYMSISENTETNDICSAIKSESIICSENGEIYNYTFIDENSDGANNAETGNCEPSVNRICQEDKRLTKSTKSNAVKGYSKVCENPNYFECTICKLVLENRTSYENHLKSHKAQPNKVYCNICGKRFADENALTSHQKKMHAKELKKEQICPFCSKVSPNMQSHREHIRYNHTDGLKHACHICEKRFQYPSKLNEHISTHTGIALYACPYCSRPFNSQANMHKHRKRVHPKEWEEERTKRIAGQELRKLSLSKTA